MVVIINLFNLIYTGDWEYVMINQDDKKEGDDEDNVDDTLPLLPASAILCRRGELETPVPSSRMSPLVANAAAVRRMFVESWFLESILTAVANAERLPIDLLTISVFVVCLVGDPRSAIISSTPLAISFIISGVAEKR